MNARILIVLLLAVSATGCVDNNASVRLSAVCTPPAPSDTGICAYSATCDTVWMDNLAVDPSFSATGGTLIWPFQADNQRPSNRNNDGAANTATAFITGYKLTYVSGSISLPTLTIDDTTRVVEAASSQVLSIPVIPMNVATLLTGVPGGLAQVRAEIRAIGHYGDGQTFETGPFSVVVDVVVGGWTGATCADPTQSVVGYCPQPGQTSIYTCK